TPAMLALLATFNALVLLALAYDRTRPSAQPEVWRMSLVMYLAAALSTISLVEFFGLFFLGHDIAGLPHPQLQTVMFVALTVAGYFTLLVARTRGPFWSLRPAPVLLAAIASALGMSLIVALLGWFMTPISWQWVLMTLGYSAIWFIVGDIVKQVVYRLSAAHHTRALR
ncbi:MAG TPA: cation transporting ATPase C-terminal domain-containing protein, partial [Ktedonobacterales bacterium]|nr:cation transporting ATPase C-terminal domain-containing protein [Ktedonobacterales bacterium]